MAYAVSWAKLAEECRLSTTTQSPSERRWQQEQLARFAKCLSNECIRDLGEMLFRAAAATLKSLAGDRDVD
jgi:hypothetical protein